MARVFLLYIRSRPVPDFHWLKIAACSLGVNELIIKLCQWTRKAFSLVLSSFGFLTVFLLPIIEQMFYNVKCVFQYCMFI